MLQGCSSLTYTRPGHPYDGSGHALSSVVCASYHGTHDSEGVKLKGGGLVDTAFIAIGGVVDVVLSLAVDTVRVPIDLFRENQERPKWDSVNHWKVGDCKNYDVFIHQMP